MDDEIKMEAHIEPANPNACRFTVDRMVYPQGSAHFHNKEEAEGSPLPQKLFAIYGVRAVWISGYDVTVEKEQVMEWREEAKEIADAIREHIRERVPAVAEGYAPQGISQEALKQGIQELFDSHVNPAVAQHGGVIELLDVKDNKVFIRMGGGCQGCGMAAMTLRQGVERAIRQKFAQVERILDVTDHASGENPYYNKT